MLRLWSYFLLAALSVILTGPARAVAPSDILAALPALTQDEVRAAPSSDCAILDIDVEEDERSDEDRSVDDAASFTPFSEAFAAGLSTQLLQDAEFPSAPFRCSRPNCARGPPGA